MDSNKDDQSANSLKRSSSSMGLPSEQSKNSLPFCDSPKDLVEKVLKTGDFRLFIQDQEILPEGIVDLAEPPAALYDKVYDDIATIMARHQFPSSLHSKLNFTLFVLAVLGPIVDQIRKEFKVGADKLAVECNSVLPKTNSESSFLADSSRKIGIVVPHLYCGMLTRLVVVDVKSNIVEEAYEQCMHCLLRVYQLNNDRLPLYGFCTNAIDWNVIKYDGQKFSMLFKSTGMFPGMDKRVEGMNDDGQPEKSEYEHKQYWLDKGYAKMVDIIYFCLKNQLTRINEHLKLSS